MAEGTIDFGGLANQAPRAGSYAGVVAPEAAKSDDAGAFEAAKFQLTKPAPPFIPKLRPAVSVPPLLGSYPS